MRRLPLAALTAVLIATAACGDLMSLHALYTPADHIVDRSLEGAWTDDHDRLILEPDGDAYRLTIRNITDPNDHSTFEVHLVDIDGVRFADLLGEGTIGHMIVRVRTSGGQLHFAFLDSKWLRDRVRHEEAVGWRHTQAVLTLRTPQLRALVAQYAHEPRAFDEESVFHR